MIDKIINSYNKSKEEQKKASELYLPNNIWKKITEEKEKIFKGLIKDKEYLLKVLNNFLREPAIYQNLYNIPTRVIMKEYMKWKELPEANIEDVEAPEVGNPMCYQVGECVWSYENKELLGIVKAKITTSSMRFQYFSQKIINMLAEIENPVIMEIGAGYGGLAYYYLKKTKKKTTYILFDLPESNILSTFYLSKLFPDKVLHTFDDYKGEIKEGINILPNFLVPKIQKDYCDMVLNFRSFSEMDKSTIEEYMKHVIRVLKINGFFYHENSRGRYPDGRPYYIGHSNADNKENPEVSALEFPISKDFWHVYEKRSPFYDGRYYEFLYRNRPSRDVVVLGWKKD